MPDPSKFSRPDIVGTIWASTGRTRPTRYVRIDLTDSTYAHVTACDPLGEPIRPRRVTRILLNAYRDGLGKGYRRMWVSPQQRQEPPADVMNSQKALGYLIAGAVNSALTTVWIPEDSELAACRTKCCGPCGALAWFRDHAPAAADAAVISIQTGPADRYDWQLPTGGVDWSRLSETWGRADLLHCHGQALPNAAIQKLADEAERGYSADQLTAQGHGDA
jgi:hypothetical protein